MSTDDAARAANLARWEGLAELHGAGVPGYYDVAAVAAGRNPIQDEVDELLSVATDGRGVGGLDVLHVQSHIGIDSVELARRGARVTCTDFSPTALARATELAALSGVDLTTVEAESTTLPSSLHGRFDLAYATVGTICWIADLDAWMRSVAACLRADGTLLVYDTHPLRGMTDTLDPLVMDMTYTFTQGGLSFESEGSYADPTAKLAATSGTVYAHSVAENVNAAIGAGLRITHLVEHTESSFDVMFDQLTLEADGRYRWRIGEGEPLPLQFGLLARKP